MDGVFAGDVLEDGLGYFFPFAQVEQEIDQRVGSRGRWLGLTGEVPFKKNAWQRQRFPIPKGLLQIGTNRINICNQMSDYVWRAWQEHGRGQAGSRGSRHLTNICHEKSKLHIQVDICPVLDQAGVLCYHYMVVSVPCRSGPDNLVRGDGRERCVTLGHQRLGRRLFDDQQCRGKIVIQR